MTTLASIRTVSCGLLLLVLVCQSARCDETLPPLPESAFTVVIIPDTQHYTGPGTKISENGIHLFPGMERHPYITQHIAYSTSERKGVVTNHYLRNHIDWIRSNIGKQNIVFVSHVGDIVERNRAEEWSVAKNEIDKLRGVVPFGLVVGNHDVERNGDSRLFQDTFPARSFDQDDWYKATFAPKTGDSFVSANNVNSAQVFDASGFKFLFLHLECNAPDGVLQWASKVISEHADRHVLVSTHMDLGIIEKPKNADGFINDPKGRMAWAKIHGSRGNSAMQMWEKLYRKHENIGFVFSGDQSRVTAMRTTAIGDQGNEVHSLFSDYMSFGALRLVRFIPSEDRVQVITYDTTFDRLVKSMPYATDVDQHQFSIDFKLRYR